MNFISVYDIVHLKKHFKRQNISLFAILSNAVTKVAFCTTIPARSNKAFYSIFILLPTFIKGNSIVTSADGSRSDHFLCDSAHRSFTGLFTFCGGVAILEDLSTFS